MKDPHIHIEKTPVPGFGNAAMRELIVQSVGLACDLPKTVGTGCGRRRPMAMTSLIPEHVTCLACREYAAGNWAQLADSAQGLIPLLDKDPELAARARVTKEGLAAQAAHAREMTARFRRTP